MLSQLLSLILLLVVAAVYLLYLRPLKRIQKYVKDFERAGYKVYMFPYNPFGFSVINTLFKDSESGDGYRSFKTKFANYDILVGNALTTPVISLLSPESRK